MRRRVAFAVCLLVEGFAGGLAAIAAAPTPDLPLGQAAPGLAVEGTEFVLRQENGKVLRSAELVGAELDLPDGTTLRIDAVRADPGDASGETVLHTFSLSTGDGRWQNPCDADREGHREGFPIAGRWDAAGRLHTEPGHFALSCTSGAQAKCVRFGYKPWKAAPDGAPLAPIYEACVHMVRADYCGDGTPTTRDGTEIDIFDQHGVQQPTSDPAFRFEAGWAPTGAVCVAHTRIPDNITLDQLRQRCPRLATALGDTCTLESAVKLGAVLFNRSR